MISVQKIGSMISADWTLPHRYYLYGYWHGAHQKDNTFVLEGYYPEHLCWKAYFEGFEDGNGDRELWQTK